MFHTLAPELAEASGVDIEFAQCGELLLALDEDEATALYAANDGRRQRRGREWFTAKAVRDMEPALSESIAGAVYTPEVCRLNNQRLSAA